MPISISNQYRPLKVCLHVLCLFVGLLLILYYLCVLVVYLSFSHSAPYPCFATAMIQYPQSDQ